MPLSLTRRKRLRCTWWERVGVRVNITLFQPLTSPSPLSPPTRGGEIWLFTSSSIIDEFVKRDLWILSFRGVLTTKNLNDSSALRFLPLVEMTNNDSFTKVSKSRIHHVLGVKKDFLCDLCVLRGENIRFFLYNFLIVISHKSIKYNGCRRPNRKVIVACITFNRFKYVIGGGNKIFRQSPCCAKN